MKKHTLLLNLTAVAIAFFVGMLPQTTMAENRVIISKTSEELPVVESVVLDTNINVPWSQPVKIKDPFEGEFVGIFDRNYFYQDFLNAYVKIDVVSLWRSDVIQILLAYSEEDCLTGINLGSRCKLGEGTAAVVKLYIKLGERVFELEGKNGTFQVSEELATALKNSPLENVSIRLIAESGATIDSQIGKKTVEAWKAIY